MWPVAFILEFPSSSKYWIVGYIFEYIGKVGGREVKARRAIAFIVSKSHSVLSIVVSTWHE